MMAAARRAGGGAGGGGPLGGDGLQRARWGCRGRNGRVTPRLRGPRLMQEISAALPEQPACARPSDEARRDQRDDSACMRTLPPRPRWACSMAAPPLASGLHLSDGSSDALWRRRAQWRVERGTRRRLTAAARPPRTTTIGGIEQFEEKLEGAQAALGIPLRECVRPPPPPLPPPPQS